MKSLLAVIGETEEIFFSQKKKKATRENTFTVASR